MKVYIVQSEDNGVERVFDSLEKAKKYIAETYVDLVECEEHDDCYGYAPKVYDNWPYVWLCWFEVQ